MIQTVLFDFGGVLTEGGKAGSIRAMFAQAYGIDPQQVILDDSVQAAFRGLISDEELIARVNKLNPQCQPASATIFIDNADFFTRCEPVYALADQLRRAGIKTALFSNVFASSAEALQEDGFYDGFDPLFLSYIYHMQKPEKQLYQLVIERLQLAPSEVLFIDDKDEYLAPARDLGMHTVLAVSPQQIVADTTALIAAENKVEV